MLSNLPKVTKDEEVISCALPLSSTASVARRFRRLPGGDEYEKDQHAGGGGRGSGEQIGGSGPGGVHDQAADRVRHSFPGTEGHEPRGKHAPEKGVGYP